MPDLTPEGKKAVQDTWAPVAANPKHFGVLLFIRYFEEYPRTQDFFEHFKGKSLEELKTSPKLRAHGTTVLHAVTAMVENLDDPDTMVVLLNNTVDRHTPRTVGFPEYAVGTMLIVAFPEEYAVGTMLIAAFPEYAVATVLIVAFPEYAMGTMLIVAFPDLSVSPSFRLSVSPSLRLSVSPNNAALFRQDLFKCIGGFLADQLGDKFDETAKTAWGIVLDTMSTVIKAQLDKQ
ncbi:hypothetical protein LSAT2_032024 [Lamellibrachia satsuma]|nr:hypothetical protein LSAT2_032024 [Lamellibrachia satsuma]